MACYDHLKASVKNEIKDVDKTNVPLMKALIVTIVFVFGFVIIRRRIY